MFRHEYPARTMERTLSYGSSENFGHTASDAGIFIT